MDKNNGANKIDSSFGDKGDENLSKKPTDKKELLKLVINNGSQVAVNVKEIAQRVGQLMIPDLSEGLEQEAFEIEKLRNEAGIKIGLPKSEKNEERLNNILNNPVFKIWSSKK